MKDRWVHRTECMNCGRISNWDTRKDAKEYEKGECYGCGEESVFYMGARK